MGEGWHIVAAVELFFSASALQLCVVFAVWWWLRREDRYLAWFAGWALTAGLFLMLQTALFVVPRTPWAVLLIDVRPVLLGMLGALLVPPVCLLARRPIAWWLVAAVGAVYAVRTVLTAATDLVWQRGFDSAGYPVYEPLHDVFSFAPLLVLGLLLPQVLRIEDAGQRHPLLVGVLAAALIVPVAPLTDEPWLRDLATGAWSLPMVAALTLVGMRRIALEESGRRRLVSRQAALLDLGQAPADEVAARAEEHLARDLGRPVTVGCAPVPAPQDRAPDARSGASPHTASTEGRVAATGHRFRAEAVVAGRLTAGDRDFARAVLHQVVVQADRVAAEEELRRTALYDALTGLPNRLLLVDRLEHAVERVRRHGGLVAVLFCDLDEFKTVNDDLGHEVGDALLTRVATRLDAVARDSDTVARFGGDEFVVVAEQVDSVEHASLVAERMRQAAASVLNPATDRPVRMSVGVAAAGSGRVSATQLLREADMAMYQAKRRGAGIVRVDV